MHNNKNIFERLLNTYYIITIVYHCMFKETDNRDINAIN